jgi:hypothetical protein
LSEIVNTYQVADGFAASDDIVLEETPKTRLLFRPGIHNNGVRGYLVRQKRGRAGTWCEVNDINFTSMPPDCGVRIELTTQATSRLYDKLDQLYTVQSQGIEPGDQSFVLARQDEAVVIDDSNKATAIRALLDKGYSEEFWNALTQDDPDLATRLAIAKVEFDRRQVVTEYEVSLALHNENEDFWQVFFQQHPWILQAALSVPVFYLQADCYIGGKRAIGRQGSGGVATDFLFSDESTKSFAAVEIKTPATGLVGASYRGQRDTGYDNETYSMHSDLTGGIVQVRNQIAVAVEDFRSVIGRDYVDLNCVHPKGVLIAGTASRLRKRQKDSFNHFRQSLFGLTVITYDELLHRLKLLFERVTLEVLADEVPSSDTAHFDDPPF